MERRNSVTTAQAHELMSKLATGTDWSRISVVDMHAAFDLPSFHYRFSDFIRNGARFQFGTPDAELQRPRSSGLIPDGDAREFLDHSLLIMGRLYQETQYAKLDSAVVQAAIEDRELGFKFAQLIINHGHFRFRERVISIDRSRTFDPMEFRPDHFKFFPHVTVVEQDQRALLLTELDLSNVKLIFGGDKTWDRGWDRFRDVQRQGCVRLDAKVFQVVWENRHCLPDEWVMDSPPNGPLWVMFDGTIIHGGVLESDRDEQSVPYMVYKKGMWRWDLQSLMNVSNPQEASAVLTV